MAVIPIVIGARRTVIIIIVEIGQTTEKSPGDLRRLAVTQTPVENHKLTLVSKTIKWV